MPAALLDLTLGLVLVLGLRRPVRRLLGAGPAFTLWAWPPLLTALAWLPVAPSSAWVAAPVLVEARRATAALTESGVPHGEFWLALWLTGAALGLLRLGIVYTRLRHAARPLDPALASAVLAAAPALDPRRLRSHPQGPAVLWGPRSLVLLPADFAADGDRHRMRLVLAHEQSHLRRRDPLWTLLAELATALLWFHPLSWLALPRFRLDQELACDERTLRSVDTDAAAYARTLISSAGMDVAPVLTPWLAEPQLKERLTMIRRHRTRTPIRIAGTLSLVLAGTGLALAVQTTPSPEPAQAVPSNLSLSTPSAIHYPAEAIKNKEQGTVVLKVKINPDGSVKQVDYDPKASTTTSGNLIAAASEAAMRWRFNPAIRDGKAIESYAKVPVKFDIDPLPPASEGAEAGK